MNFIFEWQKYTTILLIYYKVIVKFLLFNFQEFCINKPVIDDEFSF